jgi:hypothetical protein
MNVQVAPAMSDTDAYVLDATGAKVRTFLYGLAEGTTDYRSLHNLTEQVEHQYHGRFLVELIQNAHDQLPEATTAERRPARIEVALTDEGPHGTLYVANDGKPFSRSNFDSLSNLGQSDKDPQASIGHKGIGFRSVLEITESPEIYSRHSLDSAGFDGFCFAFSPAVIRQLYEPIAALVNGNDDAAFPFGAAPLVDWDAKMRHKLRFSVQRRAEQNGLTVSQWLQAEMKYLSAYTLPFPLMDRATTVRTREFERHGFSTVIRFPLKSAAARASVVERLTALQPRDLLFLPRLSCLTLDSGDGRRQLTRRQQARVDSVHRGYELTIEGGGGAEPDRFLVWERVLALTSAPEPVQASIAQLPGKWPLLRHATVSIAVPTVVVPEPGTFSIFLPTPLETGLATHVNAPFFGDMSRTHIDFGDAESGAGSPAAVYNGHLLGQAAELAVAVISEELAGQSVEAACAIVDLLAPCGQSTPAIERWRRLIVDAAQARELSVNAANWLLSDHGWTSLQETSLLPDIGTPSVLTEALIREHATFAIYARELASRRDAIESLSNAHDIDAEPPEDDRANTVEQIALALHSQASADWNGFWTDASAFLDEDLSPLEGKRVLLGSDGELHASGDDSTVFFIPRQGAGEDEELENPGDVREIPPALRRYVAFLSDRVQVYEEKGGRLQQTPTRKRLQDSRLVSRFRREDILNDVLLARTPTLPVAMHAAEAGLCQDILLWGLRLMADLVHRGKGERLLQLLGRLPAPCHGGWIPLAQSSFGPGWPGTNGDAVAAYLRRINTPEARTARDRLLLPPDHQCWGREGVLYLDLLRLVGVFDGLRLLPIPSNAWVSQFEAYRADFQLPAGVPPGWSTDDWRAYREVTHNAVTPAYNRGRYEVQRLNVVPGLDQYASFDEDTRLAFMDVVFRSAADWPLGWWALTVDRVGGYANTLTLPSPLAWKLRQCAWIGVESDDGIDWGRPADRWHVPAHDLAGGRTWQFLHLRPLPARLADLMDREPRLAAAMQRLDMPHFDPETKSPSSRLLEALADATSGKEIRNWDIFLGQVRAAWSGFEPTGAGDFPRRLLIHGDSAQLSLHTPDSDHPVYLPDSAKSFVAALRRFQLPVIAIEPADAKRLAEPFTNAFPGAVVRASSLQPIPRVNGTAWTEPAPDRLQDQEQFEWLAPLVLTLAAFFGPQAQGASTEAFRRHLKSLREARVAIAETIETTLLDGDRQVARPMAVAALWHSETRTLLVKDPSTNEAAALSEALASLLDRGEDLEVAIKLVLGIIGWDPTEVTITLALEQLKLEHAHYRLVREHWRGDLSLLIERMVPLLAILRPDTDVGRLMELDTEEAAVAFVDQLEDPHLDGRALLRMARGAADMFTFGTEAARLYGDAAQLAAWNAALAKRGQAPLTNTEADAEFRAHLIGAGPVLRSLLAWLSARHPELGPFTALAKQLEGIGCPEALRTETWDVRFGAVMAQVTPLFETWQTSPEVLDALRAAKSPAQLRTLLAAQGIDVSFDPSEAGRENRERLRAAVIRLQQLGLAWAITSNAPNPADWEGRTDRYLQILDSAIEQSGFTHYWTDADVWQQLQSLPMDEASTAFWLAVREASDLDDVAQRLGLSPEAVNAATARLEELKERARRTKRLVQVCGREFDGSEDNLGSLWTHIVQAMPATTLANLPTVELGKVAPLVDMVRRDKPPPPPPPPPPPKPRKRVSKAMENLIGLSGEIHAFRMLQNQYGPNVVSAACWVSGNSALAGLNPPEKTKDGHGSDFVIVHEGHTYNIEVKSSEGENDGFTLTSSEIRLAKDLARYGRRRRKETFQILCVSNVLTDHPSFRMLPNPYDRKYQSQFLIEEADARVRYRAKPS